MIKAMVTLLLGLAILGGGMVVLGGIRFWEDLDEYEIVFSDVQDLSAGRPVKYAGVDIGRVLSMGISDRDPGSVTVRIGVDEGFHLYEGTVAQISQKGLVGDKYVALRYMGESDRPVLIRTGGAIPSRRAYGLHELAEVFGAMMHSLQPRLERIAGGLEQLVGGENQKTIRSVLVELHKTMTIAQASLQSLENEATATSAAMRREIRSAGKAVDAVRTDLHGALGSIERSATGMHASVGRVTEDWLVTTRSLRTAVDRTAASMDALGAQLQGDLAHDQEQVEDVLDNLNTLILDLRRLARSLNERPWQIIYKPRQVPDAESMVQ